MEAQKIPHYVKPALGRLYGGGNPCSRGIAYGRRHKGWRFRLFHTARRQVSGASLGEMANRKWLCSSNWRRFVSGWLANVSDSVRP